MSWITWSIFALSIVEKENKAIAFVESTENQVRMDIWEFVNGSFERYMADPVQYFEFLFLEKYVHFRYFYQQSLTDDSDKRCYVTKA